MLAISIPAFQYADHWGRRTSAITGGAILSGCMLLIGTLYATNSVHAYGAARWVVVVLVFVFGLAYAATWGVVGKIYASEIQPAKTRAAANCIAQGLGFVRTFPCCQPYTRCYNFEAKPAKVSCKKNTVDKLASRLCDSSIPVQLLVRAVLSLRWSRVGHDARPGVLYA